MSDTKRRSAVLHHPGSRARTHFVSPKLARRQRAEKGGYGVFAVKPVRRGELLVVWGGSIVTSDRLQDVSSVKRRHSIQVEDELYLVPTEMPEVGDFINHSCSPNAGMSGQTSLVALRSIMPGEEICYDYAMSDGSPYDEFSCSCQAVTCRGRVTGNDWALPDLQLRYAGYFSPYLQRRIDEARMPDSPILTALGAVLAEAP